MTSTDLPQDAHAAPHHRRSREEVEALAKNFVATPLEEDVAPPKRSMLLAAVAGAVVLAGVVAYLAWPSSEQAVRPASDTARAAAEVEELRKRLEAERERQRQELQASADYVAKMAAADAALVKDLTAQADRLADRQAALAPAAPAPAPARSAPATSKEQLPTPREEAARTAAAPAASTATTAPATAPSGTQQKAVAPAPTQQQAEPAAPAPAPAQAEPTAVVQADKASCAIHVSELSASGKLTYEGIKKMKGVRIDEGTGHVFTPPVPAAGGRNVVFEVMPSGCVSVVRR